MKLFSNFYKNLFFKPSFKFILNLFELKKNFNFFKKNQLYISIYMTIKQKFSLKKFSFNYIIYYINLKYFIFFNISFQLVFILFY